MRTRQLVFILFIVINGITSTWASLFALPLSGNRLFINHLASSDSIPAGNQENPVYYETLTLLPPSRLEPQRMAYLMPSSAGSSRFLFESKYYIFQNPHLYSTYPALNPVRPLTAFPSIRTRINHKRAVIFGGGNAAAIFFGFKQTTTLWGKSNGRFHVKADWTGDHLAQTDELSHFMWGYKMTQFFFSTYHWIGLSPHTGQLLSLVESALILTAVEYPVDAYNPQQGLGESDLIFDYMGIGFAYAKKHCGWLGNLDFKISWKRNIFIANHSAFAQTYTDYDNTVYWLTYRTSLIIPRKIVCWGLGYSTTHVGIEPRRQFYLGVGLSLSDFVGLFGKKLERHAEFLDLFYPNFKLKL